MPGSKRRALKKLLSPSNSQSSTPVSGAPLSVPSSGTSIASDPNNYMSDEALHQDLVVEEMMEREKSIGTGSHRAEDGLSSLSYNQGPGAGTSSNSGPSATVPPPPPAGAGMYNPQQMTAEHLMFGDETGGGGAGGGGKKKNSKQRHAERLARRQEALINSAPPSDPDWTAQLEKERQEEIHIISDACTSLGRAIYEIAPDGHCMFSAIADQLAIIGLIPSEHAQDPRYIRQAAASYMAAHADDFMPFLPSVTGEDSADATEDGMMTEKGFRKYCSNVAETGEWGGEPEIQALSRAFKVPIHVIQRGPPTVVSHGGNDDSFGGGLTPEQSATQGDRVIRISYHKRMYGLGEHYNSLRKI